MLVTALTSGAKKPGGIKPTIDDFLPEWIREAKKANVNPAEREAQLLKALKMMAARDKKRAEDAEKAKQAAENTTPEQS